VTQEGPDDKELMAAIVKRDRTALEALYDRYAGAIYSLSMYMLKQPEAAEEVTQDVFLNVWRRASSYNSERGKLTSWLFSIAHHRAIDELRRRRRDYENVQHGVDLSNRPTEGGDDPLTYTSLEFERVKLKDALSTLRPEQREVVLLAYFGGFTHSEIAAKLDQRLGTVKTRMRLALKKLREVLGPNVQEFADYGL
jgi:RNA polymerase sigma-70 factor (ECF subfamily)